MIESQLKRKEAIEENWATYKKLMPEIADAYEPLPQEVYKDGSIKSKHKRLMALVGALTNGCSACVLYQTGEAIEVGATVDEILESCAVAVSLGGTMAAGETARVIALLKELGKID